MIDTQSPERISNNNTPTTSRYFEWSPGRDLNPRPAAFPQLVTRPPLYQLSYRGCVFKVFLLGFRCYRLWVRAVKIVIRARIRVRKWGLSFSEAFSRRAITSIEDVIAVMLEDARIRGGAVITACSWIRAT